MFGGKGDDVLVSGIGEDVIYTCENDVLSDLSEVDTEIPC